MRHETMLQTIAAVGRRGFGGLVHAPGRVVGKMARFGVYAQLLPRLTSGTKQPNKGGRMKRENARKVSAGRPRGKAIETLVGNRRPALRAEPAVRMSLHEYLDNIFTDRCNGIDNYACQVETLGKILGENPILKEEVRLINQLSKTLKRLCDLRDEAHTEFENYMNAEQPGVGVSPAA